MPIRYPQEHLPPPRLPRRSQTKAGPRSCAFTPKALGLLLACLFSSPATLPAASVTQLKVLSFNIWVQGGLSLSNCIEIIRTTGADIVGLQECNQTTAQTIATSLGFYVLLADDCSVVSRFPILSSYVVSSRGAGVTVQLSPGQRAHLFNCHLVPFPYGPYSLHDGATVASVISDENSIRMPALNQLLGVMQPFIDGFEPCFFTGDFNAPSHLDYASLGWPTSLACVNAGLLDSYRQLHSTNRTFPAPFAYTDPGITWTPKTNQEPDGVFDRIDFIYQAAADGVTPMTSVELDERNSINPWPSDHRAVLSTFQLVPPTLVAKASLPEPANQATNVSVEPRLIWLPGSNSTSHLVYFGTVAPTNLVTNTTVNELSLKGLAPGTTYRWRVDETTPGGTVPGDTWSFTTRPSSAAIYEWNFANSNLQPALGNGVLAYADGATTSNLTSFGTTDGLIIPHIGGKPAKYLRAPAFTGISNGYAVTFPNSPPNGGGGYINQYTMIFDLLLPAPINWFPFFNTAPSNPSGNDADFYVAPDGSLGIAAIGYSAVGLIQTNTWYRITFAADLAGGTATYYLNGSPVCTGNADVDGRHSVYSNTNPGPDLLLFNEGDISGVYTHVVYLSAFFFTDRTMTSSEIQSLGGPRARGIFSGLTPIQVAIAPQGTNFLLSWTPGNDTFQVQKNTSLTGAWQNVGPPTTATNATLPFEPGRSFFRVVGQ